MAKRIISAAIAIPIGLGIILLQNDIILTIAMAAFAVVATYEILVATKYLENTPITVVSILYVAVVPFLFNVNELRHHVIGISFSFLVALFIILIFNHEKVTFEEVSTVAVISILIPLSFGSVAFIQSKFNDVSYSGNTSNGTFYIIFMLIATWIGDAGAYFIGTFFGKHKMAPEISPKKSWEGFFGGIVTSAVFGVILGFGYMFWDKLVNGEATLTVNVLYLVAVAVVCSGLGVIGDFSASILKRQFDVKDFGNFMPGHGGVMDRFDSLLFAAPFVYLLFQYLPPVTIL